MEENNEYRYTLKEIKEIIYDAKLIKEILESLGCELIKSEQNGNLITAKLPSSFESENKRAVQIKNNSSLTSNIRNRGITGDIFSVIGYILFDYTDFEELKSGMGKVMNWLNPILGIGNVTTKATGHKSKQQSWNGWLKDIKAKRNKEVVIIENKPYGDEILTEYMMYPNDWWKQEGLSYRTQIEFEIGFDPVSQRIVIPVRDHNGKLVGIKGRYVGTRKDILDDMKYIYLKKCNKSLMLYNWHKAIPHILNKKEVIVVESEKTTMYLHQFGYKNAVAIGGDSLSDIQIEYIKNLGIDTKVILAYDKDKSFEFINSQVSRFNGRLVCYLYDSENLFSGKQSPTDLGKPAFDSLYSTSSMTSNKKEIKNVG